MSNTTAVPVLLGLTLLMLGCDSSNRSPTDSGPTPSRIHPSDEMEPDSNSGEPVDQGNTPSETQFAVADRFPQADDANIALVTHISVTFNEPLLDQGSDLNVLQVYLYDQVIQGNQQQLGEHTLQFIPHNALQPNSTYRVAVNGSAMSQSGQQLPSSEWQFDTVGDVHTTTQDAIDFCMSEQDIEMLAAVNAARSESRHCGDSMFIAADKLSWSCKLQWAAVEHAKDMSNHNFFSHTGTDGSSVGNRTAWAGYEWGYVGENIAAGQRNVEQVMAGWLDSPGHCRNIMSPHYTEFGFGYSSNPDADYQRYWAQVFARPSSHQ